MRRSGVDDAAPFARLHARKRGANRMEGGRKIDGDDLVPFLDRKFLDRRDMLDAGIVDEHVETAEGLLGRAHHLGDRGGLAHVGCRVERLDAEILLDAASLLFDRGLITEAIDGDVRAFAGQRAGNGQADARGRAGYERCLSFQHHAGLPNMRRASIESAASRLTVRKAATMWEAFCCSATFKSATPSRFR